MFNSSIGAEMQLMGFAEVERIFFGIKDETSSDLGNASKDANTFGIAMQ